jgi:hypothetical protein
MSAASAMLEKDALPDRPAGKPQQVFAEAGHV